MSRREALIAIAFLAVGFCIRFWCLDSQILWHDEIYTKFFVSGYRASQWKAALFTNDPIEVSQVLFFQKRDPGSDFFSTLQGLAHDEPQHPPLYYAILRGWIDCFGDSTFVIRLLSVVFSMLAIPAMYWFTNELFGLRRVSFYSAALLSVSPMFVRYAQEAREYALWSALVLLSSAALLRALRRAGFGSWSCYSLVTALALYASLSTVSVMGAQALFIMLRERRINRTILSAGAAFGVSSVFFLPWAILILGNLEAFEASMAWSKQIIVPRSEIFATLASSASRPFLDFWNDADNIFAWGAIFLALALITVSVSHLRRSNRDARILVALLLLFPIAILSLPDLIFGGIRSVSTRYLMPSLLTLIAVASFWIAGQNKIHMALGVLLLVFALSNNVYNAGRVSWTKGISMSLPEVAKKINESNHPLVVGNMERHHPGNLIALCYLLKTGTKLQFLNHGVKYNSPKGYDVFLFSPIPPFLENMAERRLRTNLLIQDLHLSLYRVL